VPRTPTPNSRAPVAINKYLLPREVQVATMRQHPAVLVVPGTEAVAGLVLGITLTLALQESLPQLMAIWTAVTLLMLHCLRVYARWSVDYLCVTSERIVQIFGFSHRSVTQIPLHELVHLSLVRTFAGRLLGYGALVNGSQLISAYVPYPEQLYLLIEGVLYPTSADDPED
jgi:Bacterial PH domain